jgi:hypothetical protein
MTRTDVSARWRVARRTVLVLAAIAAASCGNPIFGKVYEYEEDVYVSLDGSADVIINTSIPALVALRGITLNTDPSARLDREQVRAAYTSPVAEVTRVSRPWTRQGRRFVQVRVRVPDLRRLSQAAPFAWSTYALDQEKNNGVYVYKQTVGASALHPGTLKNVGWKGGELVAFRLHLPSRIVWHNARDLETNEPSSIARGNILAWEQPLADRLDGRPLAIEVRMDRQSILYRTLWLFAGAFAAAVALIAIVIWIAVRKGGTAPVD